MLRNLVDRWRGSEREEPWRELLRSSDAGIRSANESISAIVDRAGGLPEKISAGEEPVALFEPGEAEDKWEAILSGVESELRRLCGLYNYRKLLFLSRLCSGLPALRARDPEMESTRVRSQNADRWILRCADRCADRDYLRLERGGYSIGGMPTAIFHDAVKPHVLADLHNLLGITRMTYNLMRLVSSENDLRPGPLLRLRTMSRIGHVVEPIEIRKLASVHSFRYEAYNGAFSMWAMFGPDSTEEPDALAYGYFQDVTPGAYGGGSLFAPGFTSLRTLIEYGKRFRQLFERDDGIGVPPEHLRAITRGLRNLGLLGTAREGPSATWARRTGTLLIPREELLGGSLEKAARDELTATDPERSDDDLARSVERFVALASSSGDVVAQTGQVRDASHGAPIRHAERERDAASDRTLGYPYMIHGGLEHELWIVDFVNTLPFYQSLAKQLRFSPSNKTTATGQSESYERTSVFDVGLAETLTSVPGVEAAFPEIDEEEGIEKETPELPNVTFRLEGGENREIDVPLRYGAVLVAVQTWARKVDPRIDEGDYRTIQRRWSKAKKKLAATDKYYTDYLLHDPGGRRHMAKRGLRYVLPLLCGPFTEPVASIEDRFWLRYPSMESFDSPEESIPRLLTPFELERFLSTTSEEGLANICEKHGWTL
ncbi:MAG: hypothetical protein M3P49_07115 [Actinomycetota bacterium]|nr:hypothetical protein [Actinomycetota bacterium]